MFCVPECRECVARGTCPLGEVPVPRPVKPRRIPENNDYHLIRMPCGCHALPVDLVGVLGSNMKSFLCEHHGEQKVTKTWLKRSQKIGKKIATEFGYKVVLEEGSTLY